MKAIEYAFGATHYASRKTREALHIRGCRQEGGPSCGGAFKCTRCKRLVGWCRGASDGTEADNWCDRCAATPTKGATNGR